VPEEHQKRIASLPYVFALSLSKHRRSIPFRVFIALGVANLLGWMAYTIYDNFLDEEGDPRLLPCANIALRKVQKIFETQIPKKDFQELYTRIMDQIEHANSWEVHVTRVPVERGVLRLKNFPLPSYGTYEVLAQKSAGHALGPLAVLSQLGYKTTGEEMKLVQEFFRHYLIARQLCDDAHDWEKDMRKGHINAVGALILRKVSYKSDQVLLRCVPKLQKVFWQHVIVEVCKQVTIHLDAAKRCLKKATFVEKKTYMEEMLTPYEKVVVRTLEERAQALQFIKTYTRAPRATGKNLD
jgi:hypothetical protein